jgi:hypothetical protein
LTCRVAPPALSTARGIIGAIAGRLASFNPAVQNSLGATDTGSHGDSLLRTVDGAGAAFYTGITINNLSLLFPHLENGVRADQDAHRTAVAFVLLQLKRNHVRQVSKT